jgi:hypothetical protein
MMKALSVKQPWAWLICAGYKDIENRNWRIGRKPVPGMSSANFALAYPARIYIHAGKVLDNSPGTWEYLEGVAALTNDAVWWDKFCEFSFIDSLPLGVIIGEVDIVGILTSSPSPWFTGKYGFMLKNPKLYDQPIPYYGQLGFFEVNL